MVYSLQHVALIVRDYDEAIEWFTSKLGFRLVADEYQLEQDKRWVLIEPPAPGGASILLARATSEDQQRFIGDQAGGRVFLFLHTTNFWEDFEQLTSCGVHFVRGPTRAAYGTVAAFADLYGNLWDLVQLA